MRNKFLILLIGLMLFTGCAAPPAPVETPTAPVDTATKIPTATAVPLLIPLLSHSDKWLASLAADDLRMIGPGAEAAIPALLVVIDDKDTQLAGEAAFALGSIGRADEDVLAALIRHVNDDDFSKKMFVQSSLERLTGEKFTKPEQWLDWWSKRPTPTP